MVNFSVLLSNAAGVPVGAGGFYSYDDAVDYMSDWSDVGIASVVDFHTGEVLFTLVPADGVDFEFPS